MNNQHLDVVAIEETGPWPFRTQRVYRFSDQSSRIWNSRRHRKGLLDYGRLDFEILASMLSRCVWRPGNLNWWIGVVFALGAVLFAGAGVLSLWPSLSKSWSLDAAQINGMFFAGSIPFTIAAYLQLYQAANVCEFVPREASAPCQTAYFGWRPGDIGWSSGALQFVGTILFNFNTLDAMLPSLNWWQQDFLIWIPDLVGSILFLVSGYLAFIETCHAHWSWQIRDISWWVVFSNLLGCIGFMLSALFAMSLPSEYHALITISMSFTLFGAIGFLVGSLLMLPESVTAA